jgi:Importin-beta N-terminal domain
MKNTISSNWEDKEEGQPSDVNAFVIHENDKQVIREHIVEAVIASTSLIR